MSTANLKSSFQIVINKLISEYSTAIKENKKLLMIDALLIYSMCTAIIQVK